MARDHYHSRSEQHERAHAQQKQGHSNNKLLVAHADGQQRAPANARWLANHSWMQGISARIDEQRRRLTGAKDGGFDKIVSTVREPFLDQARAEWIAEQLLTQGDHGVLLPVNTVLDAYVRGKARHYLRRCAPKTTLVLALACICIHLTKQAVKHATERYHRLHRVVTFLSAVAFPTALWGPLLAARLML